MKKLYALLVMMACLGTAACQRPLHADNPILAGEVPRCGEMLLPSNEEYRRVAKQECDAAQTPEEKKNSGGCAILYAMKYCSNSVTAGYGLVEPPVEKIEE